MHELSAKQIEELWDANDGERKRQKKRQDYYDGKHGIVGRNETYVDGSDKSERVANWVRFGVNMYVGSITAQAYVVTNKNEDTESEGPETYTDIADKNNLAAADVQNLRNAMLKGYGLDCYEFVDGEISITACDPLDWTLVYDSAGNMYGGVYRTEVSEGTIHNGELLDEDVELMVSYDDIKVWTYERTKKSSMAENGGWTLVDEADHGFGRVPLVVWGVNEHKETRLTDDLLGQVDEYNDIDSMSGDDIRQDTDNVLVIKGYSKDDVREFSETIRASKVLPLDTDGTADYLSKVTDYARIESRLRRTREHIFTGLTVPDVESILGATGETSGIALQLKFKPMIETANDMITHLKRGMRDRIDMINAIHGTLGKPIIEDYTVIINFSLPVNRIEEWQNIGALDGTVSKRTQLELLSDIRDPENELNRIQKEAEDAGVIAANSGTPEEIAARQEGQIAAELPNMEARIEAMIQDISDAALSVLVRNNTVKAKQVQAVEESTQ